MRTKQIELENGISLRERERERIKDGWREKTEFKTRLQRDDATESKERENEEWKTASIQFILVSATNLIFFLCQLNYENAQFNTEERREKHYFNHLTAHSADDDGWTNEKIYQWQ